MRLNDPLKQRIEEVWLLGCSRCSFEEISFADDVNQAAKYFDQRGWASQESTVYCPACMKGL